MCGDFSVVALFIAFIDMKERNSGRGLTRRDMLLGMGALGVGAAIAGMADICATEETVAGASTAAAELSPQERQYFIEQAQVVKSQFTLFDASQPDFVPLTLPQPLVRYEGVNYLARDDRSAYHYWRLLYWNRAKESGFDPLQIDGGGNDFNHSYHGVVSYAGAEGAAQFMPQKWRSSVDEILEGGAEGRGYYNWRQVPRLANLSAYRNASPNSVPPEMQEFVYLNAFTLTPQQWDPVRFAMNGQLSQRDTWTVTNFINPGNLQ